MKKVEDLKEFVERVDNLKKLNPKDLSSDQDLSIAIMNLISIEEHLMFSGAKTGKTSFYDLIGEIREMRKTLMQKMIKEYEGEVWCISKHLLAAAMRLFEVGTKQQSIGKKDDAYDLFNKSYDLYCLFWGLNMQLVDVKDISWQKDDVKSVAELTAAPIKIEPGAPKSEPATAKSAVESAEKVGTFGKIKSTVRKLVDCCIE